MFKPGNQYGKLTKRGSNKNSKEVKDLITNVLFDTDQFMEDWKDMDTRERMELRIKLARYILPEPKEAPSTTGMVDLPLFIDNKEDILNVMQQLDLTEDELIKINHDKAANFVQMVKRKKGSFYSLFSLVIATRFERVTVCLEGRCSIQLSYATFLTNANVNKYV